MAIKVIHIHKTECGECIQVNPIPLFEILNQKLDLLITKLNEVMTRQERFDAILTALNNTTTEIAADYQALLTEVREGTVSDESLAKAEANIQKLNEIAASNDQPIPGETIPPITEGGL
jgi:hypothetical protein